MDIRHENVEYSDLNIPIYCRTVISNEENISANFHIHEEIEIVYVSKGSQTFTFIDESVIVHEGEILVINSMCPPVRITVSTHGYTYCNSVRSLL